MKKTLTKFLSAFVLLCCAGKAQAREPYHATILVGPVTATVSAPNLVDLSRELKSTSIESLIPFYTPISPVGIDINLRGILALTAFPANSTTLIVQIPQTGTTQTFTGGTREESIRLFKDFIRDGGKKHELLRAYAKYSPIDPIAGNPNSLLASMAQSDYLLGRLSPLSGCDSCWSAQPIVHQFQAGMDGVRGFSKGFETTTVSLPLRYSYSPDGNLAIIIDAPFTYFRNDGASSLFGSLGVGFRYPINHEWSLTPTLRLGAGGSMDLCTAGCFVSAGIMSVYNYKLFDYVLSMTNYAGYYTSTNCWLTGINFNYRLQNYIFKNGLSFTTCKGFNLCERPLNFCVSFVDSYFTGHRLFIKHYDEVDVSIFTTCLNPYIDYDCLSLGFGYQFGEKGYQGYCLNMAYQF